MKKLKETLLGILCITIVAIGNVNAQDTREKPFSIGIKAGLNASSISGFNYDTDYEDVDFNRLNYTPGFHAGIMVQYMFSRNMGIESGLYYSQMGGEKKICEQSRGNCVETTVSMKPAYLQMPALFIYKFRFSNSFSLYPSGGFYLGYGISGKSKVDVRDDGSHIDGFPVEGDFFNDATRRLDAGMSLGVNLQYKQLVAGMSYEQGLLRINEDNVYWTDYFNSRPEKLDLFNNCFKFSVGFLF